MFRLHYENKKEYEYETLIFNHLYKLIKYINHCKIVLYDIDLIEILYREYCVENDKIPVSYYLHHSELVEKNFIKWMYENIDDVISIINRNLNEKYYITN